MYYFVAYTTSFVFSITSHSIYREVIKKNNIKWGNNHKFLKKNFKTQIHIMNSITKFQSSTLNCMVRIEKKYKHTYMSIEVLQHYIQKYIFSF